MKYMIRIGLLVAWLSTIFLVYRLGLWFIGWHKPCGCLGSLTDMLHLSPATADNLMKVVLAYLLVGSYATLLWCGKENRERQGAGCSVEGDSCG